MNRMLMVDQNGNLCVVHTEKGKSQHETTGSTTVGGKKVSPLPSSTVRKEDGAVSNRKR